MREERFSSKDGQAGPRDQMRMELMDVAAKETGRQVLHACHHDIKQNMQKSPLEVKVTCLKGRE